MPIQLTKADYYELRLRAAELHTAAQKLAHAQHIYDITAKRLGLVDGVRYQFDDDAYVVTPTTQR